MFEIRNELQKKCEEIEGYTEKSVVQDGVRYWYTDKEGKGCNSTPTYNNRENIGRVLELLDDETLRRYTLELYRLVSNGGWVQSNMTDIRVYVPLMLKATADQMKEALAKALGVEDGLLSLKRMEAWGQPKEASR